MRPVYSLSCWNGGDCPSWDKPYRLGGGAGVWDGSIPSQDDVSDSNAIDMITGAASQASAMDWTKGPVVAPYVPLVP